MSRIKYSRTLVLILLAVVLLVWFLWVNPFGWSDGKLSGEQLAACGRPDTLVIDTYYNSIDIEQVSSLSQVEAELVGDVGQSADKLTVSSTANAVTVKVPKTGIFENGSIWGLNRRKLVIRIPSDLTLESLKVISRSGSIDLYAIKASEITAESTSGSVSYEALEARFIRLSSVSGSISGGSAKASDDLKLTSTSGSVKGDDILASSFAATSASGSVAFGSIEAETVELCSVSGSVKCESLLAKSLDARSTSGSVIIEKLDFASKANLGSTSGSVKIGLVSGEDMKLTGTSLSGSVNVNGERYSKSFEKLYGNGTRTLETHSTSSSVTINW